MRVAFFEDEYADRFSPIALTRPVFELLCGHFSLRERVLRRLDITEWGALLRPHLAETYREQHPEAHVNDLNWLGAGPTLLINGRWLSDRCAFDLTLDQVGVRDDAVACILLEPVEVEFLKTTDLSTALKQLARTRRRVEIDGVVLEHPWDVVDRNARQLAIDFDSRPSPPAEVEGQVAILGSPAHIHIDATATVDPFVVLDSRNGPIWIDPGAVIGSFTQIQGPCFIGEAAHVCRAHVHGGVSIGPVCRVGGEIEASIMHAFVNKYHTGFLGHSYVCPWVNLGALSTNSDLKNDYSSVRVPLTGEPIESGQMKVGCFIGDHTKTALGSLFNTGSSIGAMCLVLPSGELLPKHLPSFSRMWHGELGGIPDVAQSIETARVVMERRNHELTPATERLYEHLFEQTQAERDAAIDRSRDKSARLSIRG